MDSQRLKQIEEIFLSAVELSTAEQKKFLEEKCRSDEELRCEVESLLTFEKTSEELIKTSPAELAAQMFAEKDSFIDKEFKHYKIKKLLGKGGMGEVYLAEDKKLNRQVALKFLSAFLWENKNIFRRFRQEAFAASALNHPNILTIYEFEAEGEQVFLVTEFVEGETLREKIKRDDLTVLETLRIAEQISLALAAAHKAEIIHRDIKPENIMLREDGIVKILDFGLAKLTGKDESNEDTESILTKTGTMMGTTSYMSPEQIRGRHDIDSRTDIWSLGVILYEMLTRRLPFNGETIGDTIASILKTEPSPLANSISDCPPELEKIINKTLAKDTAERYQQIRDLASDIKNLMNRLEFEAELERSVPAEEKTKNISAQAYNKIQKSRSQAENLRDFFDANEHNSKKEFKKEKSRFFFYASIAALLLIFGFGGILLLWNSIGSDSSFNVVNQNNTIAAADNSNPKPSLQLDYYLTVQSYNDGRYKNPFKLSGEMLFRNKDRIRLNIKSPQNGFLYILNESPKDVDGNTSFNILFPSPTANGGKSVLTPNQEIQIPEQSWFQLDEKEGTEIIWLIWSQNVISELESAKKFANPLDKGKIKDLSLTNFIETLKQKYQSKKTDIMQNDEQKLSQITVNTDILAHNLKLEHH